MKRIGIIGSSGFALEVSDIAADNGFTPVFFARDRAAIDAWAFGYDIALEDDVGMYADMPFVIGVGDNAMRQRISARLGTLKFANLIHSSATFGVGQRERVEAARGVIVCAGVRLTHNIAVGNFSVFNLNATVGHDVVIEDFVMLAPGANVSGNVHIGAGCWIGTNAAINQGREGKKLKIGENTVIGSGTVVRFDCEANAVYASAIARRIK